MNNKQFKEESGRKINEIKTPGYYIVLFFGIAIIVFFMIPILQNKENSFEVIPFIVFFIILFISAMKKIHIYEKCFTIGDKIIKYENIDSIEFIVKQYNDAVTYIKRGGRYRRLGEFSKERFLRVNLKNDEKPLEILTANYSIKQMETLLKYVEKYSSCKVEDAYTFLEQAKKVERKDLIIATTMFCILIVVVALVIKFYF